MHECSSPSACPACIPALTRHSLTRFCSLLLHVSEHTCWVHAQAPETCLPSLWSCVRPWVSHVRPKRPEQVPCHVMPHAQNPSPAAHISSPQRPTPDPHSRSRRTYIVPCACHQLLQAVHPRLPHLQLLPAHSTQRAEQHHHRLAVQRCAGLDDLRAEYRERARACALRMPAFHRIARAGACTWHVGGWPPPPPGRPALCWTVDSLHKHCTHTCTHEHAHTYTRTRKQTQPQPRTRTHL